LKIKITLLRDGAQYPKYAKDLDAGADIFLHSEFKLKYGINKIPLGFSVEIPQGFEGQIRPRSGFVLWNDVYVHNPPIDSGYKGEVFALVSTTCLATLKKGDRICQLVISPVVRADFVGEIIDDRGSGGFYSTGR